MRRQRLLLIAAILIGASLSIVAILVTVPAGALPLVTPVPPTVVSATQTISPIRSSPPATLDQPGISAIPVVKLSTDPAVPSFSDADVRAYFATHTHPDQVSGGEPETITSIEFLPARVVDERLGGTGMSPGTLLCMVTLHGNFRVSGPGGRVSWNSPTGYMVFNALTGNDIMEVVGRPQP